MLLSKWFVAPECKPNANIRLICFPYAGGNASTYLSLASHMPETVELIAVQPPGRADRMSETPYDKMEDLIETLFKYFVGLADKPYVLFGHSMGSRIAFELMQKAKNSEIAGPLAFVASGSKAPDVRCRERSIAELSDSDFLSELRSLAGTPDELLENAELMELFMPLLRADFKLAQTYVYEGNSIFECPLLILGGEQDSDITFSDLSRWKTFFSGNTDIQMIPGGHFFVDSEPEQVLKYINPLIQRSLRSLYMGLSI